MQYFFQNDFVKQIELRLIAEEAGFVDREVFHQRREFRLAFAGGQQPVIAVKRINAGGLEPAVQTVLQEVHAAFIEEHAAFLINQSLQEFEFRLGDLQLDRGSGHCMFADD